MTATKKRFRHVGITFTKNINVFAKKLENTMNSLVEEGYAVHIQEYKTGIIVMGALATGPLDTNAEGEATPPVVDEVVRRFHSLPAHKFKGWLTAIEKAGPGLMAGISREDLLKAATVIEEDTRNHANTHSPNCDTVTAGNAMVQALRKMVDVQTH